MKTLLNINNDKTWATWLVILSGTLYGFLGYFGTEIMNNGMPVVTMLFWRFFIAMLWMLIFAAFKNQSISLNLDSIKKTVPLLMSGLFYAGSSVFYFIASQQVGTGLAMVIFFAYPVFIALAVWVQNSWRISKYSIVALLAVIWGLALLEKNSGETVSYYGLAFSLIASLCYALYIYQSKHIINQFKSTSFTVLICVICALLFLGIALAQHQFSLPSTMYSWWSVLAVGIVATALPIQLLLEGMKKIGVLKTAILSALEPIVTLIVGILALNEVITITQLMGILVIIAGSIIIQFSRDNE